MSEPLITLIYLITLISVSPIIITITRIITTMPVIAREDTTNYATRPTAAICRFGDVY